MKIDFSVLQAEPLIYFLTHSIVFVCVLGACFFILGLWLGRSIWGRYKQQTRILKSEITGLQGEIAILKRKVAEQAVRPSTGPLPESPALLTEMIQMPPAAAPDFAPATLLSVAQRAQTPEAVPAPPPPAADVLPEIPVPEAPPAAPPPEPALPQETTPPELPHTPPAPAPRLKSAGGPLKIRSKKKTSPAPAPEAETPLPEPPPIAPFTFLMGDVHESEASPPVEMPTAPMPAEHAAKPSPLSAIIAPQPAVNRDQAEATPAVPVSVIPEADPELGLIYRERPPESDDLTQIRGISTVLQQRLNDLGVHSFAQVAAWNEHHVIAFSQRLAFKDRIAREKWVEQARNLEQHKRARVQEQQRAAAA